MELATPILTTFALDCPDPLELADFYAALLRLDVHPESSEEWAWIELGNGLRLAFQLAPDHVPPQWPDGAPQQAHLDFRARDLDSQHAHAISVGAHSVDPDETRETTVERGWRVYLDPAGHPFCLCEDPDDPWT